MLLCSSALALNCSCAVARPNRIEQEPARSLSGSAVTNTPARHGKWHSVKIAPSPETPKIHAHERINPVWWFKNADDPIPPAWYRPNDKSRKTKWHFRNPLHNFNFYVIGIADRKFVRSGRYPEAIANPRGGWNYSVAKYKWWRLPFLSYHRGKVDFYFGWRPRGCFGIKFNINGERHPKDKVAAPPALTAKRTMRAGS